jgi:ADP-heptose:LPS heptosyltransferase
MKFLIIQTAFLGDAILATSIAEKLHLSYPASRFDFMLRKGNEGIFENHPFIKNIYLLDKKSKLKSLFSILKQVRQAKYDYIINLHRFGSSGFITWLSGSKEKIGFDKNPFSFCYTITIKHEIGNGKHEIERNHALIAAFTDEKPVMPKLYPSESNIGLPEKISTGNYICIAPASVWFTKQFPKEKWIELINGLRETDVFLLGAENDFALCEGIRSGIAENRGRVINLAGKLSMLQTAALMKKAKMNFVNDSAPLHIASAVDAPVKAVFCSTVPAFGFGPLSGNSEIIETREKLNCRPCGLHGYKQCPQGHFKCAWTIDLKNISL